MALGELGFWGESVGCRWLCPYSLRVPASGQHSGGKDALEKRIFIRKEGGLSEIRGLLGKVQGCQVRGDFQLCQLQAAWQKDKPGLVCVASSCLPSERTREIPPAIHSSQKIAVEWSFSICISLEIRRLLSAEELQGLVAGIVAVLHNWCSTRLKNKSLAVIDLFSPSFKGPTQSVFQTVWYWNPSLQHNLSRTLPGETRLPRDLLRMWLKRHSWNTKTFTVQATSWNTYVGTQKYDLIFSNARDAYSVFIIMICPSTETSEEHGIRELSILFYHLIAFALSSKENKLFAKLSGSLSASAFLKGNNVLRNMNVPKINFHCLKGFCLPDLTAAHGFIKCCWASRQGDGNAAMKGDGNAPAPPG